MVLLSSILKKGNNKNFGHDVGKETANALSMEAKKNEPQPLPSQRILRYLP